MSNVTYITEDIGFGIVREFAIIDNGDGSFTSMLKSTYDAQLAAQNNQNGATA